jgi:hypothetical protein
VGPFNVSYLSVGQARESVATSLATLAKLRPTLRRCAVIGADLPPVGRRTTLDRPAANHGTRITVIGL